MTRRLLFVILFLAIIWTTFQIWQITVRENLEEVYASNLRQDAPGRAQAVSSPNTRDMPPELTALADRLDTLDGEVDMLVTSQRESIRRLQPAARGEGEMLMLATGYTHVAVPGVPDINGEGHGITASGVPVHEGVVAVDPAIIPLGSLVYIISDYPGVTGYYVAADRGAAIKGLRIDIFMEDWAAAAKFKRRVRVRIVE